MSRQICITFDIDWAPDWAILMCASMCVEAGAQATFFVTHETPALDLLRSMPGIELGIHPNFLPRSSHGEGISEVLSACMRMVPEARSMRTHALAQSTLVWWAVAHETPIERDVSLFLPFHKGLGATQLPLEDRRTLTRLPYYWEDDTCASWPGWDWETSQYSSDKGLMVFDFHPIHVALNTRSLSNYDRMKASLAGTRLKDVAEDQAAPFMEQRAGTRTFLQRVLADHSAADFHTVSGVPVAPHGVFA